MKIIKWITQQKSAEFLLVKNLLEMLLRKGELIDYFFFFYLDFNK